MGVKHYIVVEPDQVEDYKKAIKKFALLTEVLELDLEYKNKYELCDKLGLTKSTGPGPARNFAWDHSIKNGFKWHWVMDDNIKTFRVLNNNDKVKIVNPAFWRAMEDFCLRFENVGMAGPNYYRFAPARSKLPPCVFNTRIYSCNLMRNDIPFRWRGRYNEDTILSLDILSKGLCTIQFNMFLQEKMDTQLLKGGNTQEFYHKEGIVKDDRKYADKGTLLKSQMLASVYPDIAKVVWKWGRWHHVVDYRKFRHNKPILKSGIVIPEGIDNYGIKLSYKKKTNG